MSPLKQKIVDEYLKYVAQLQIGYLPNYDHILNMISFMEIGSTTSNPELIQIHLINE